MSGDGESPSPFNKMITGTVAAAMVMAVMSLIAALATNEYQEASQKNLLHEQQEFNAEQSEENRIFYSEPERFKRMTVDLGFNPDLAAASIMGANPSATQAASSPNAPQLPNINGALGGLLGGMPSTILDALQQPSMVEKTNSETRLNNLEADWLPLSRQAQVDYWNGRASEALSQVGVNENLARLYAEQADWVTPLSQAECLQMRSEYQRNMEQAVLAYQEAITQGSLREMYSAYSEEARSQAVLNEQLGKESKSREDYYSNLSQSEYYKSLQEFWNANLRGMFDGLPISDDLKFNLFLMRALGNEKEQHDADLVFQEVLNGCRDLSDMEYEINYQNRIEHVWGNFGMDVLGAVPNLVPNVFVPVSVGKGGFRGSSRPRSKGATNVRRKSDFNTSIGGSLRDLNYTVGRPNGTFSTGFQMKNGNVVWE